MSIMNSEEYWNSRFSKNDWEKNDGRGQTEYFARMLCENLPEWLSQEIIDNNYSICDLGCAEGDSLPVLRSTFEKNPLYGEDFSEAAIQAASRSYPQYIFSQANIFEPEGKPKYPVIICSNVIEHLTELTTALNSIVKRSSLYTIIVAPFREPKGVIAEHENQLYTSSFPLKIDKQCLIYAKSINCASKYYLFEQLLLVYSLEEKNNFTLDYLVEDVKSNSFFNQEKIWNSEKEALIASHQKQLDLLIASHQKQLDIQNEEISQLKSNINCLNSDNQALSKKNEEWKLKHDNLYAYSCKIDGELSYIKELKSYKIAIKFLLPIEKNLCRIQNKGFRIKYQVKHRQCKALLAELFSPAIQVHKKLSYKLQRKHLLKALERDLKNKEVIILPPTIDWHMPLFQRPQQLALAYSKKENIKVLFITKNIKYDSVSLLEKANSNLWLCNEEYIDEVIPHLKAAQEKIISISWTLNKTYCEKIKPAKIIYEYIDELEVFYGYGPEMEKDHKKFIETADVTVCTATKLYNQVYNIAKNPIISTNAGDYDFFSKTENYEINKTIRNRLSAYDCVIGYYGALAKWFDYNLIKEVAEKKKNWLWILVGVNYDHSLNASGIDRFSNIIYIDPQPYKELPSFLKAFDIATIPFIINEITLSTSPVKLFEYMAAKKPIIASKMPECLKYKSVNTYNNVDEFISIAETIMKLQQEDPYWKQLQLDAENNTWDKKTDEILAALKHSKKEK